MKGKIWVKWLKRKIFDNFSLFERKKEFQENAGKNDKVEKFAEILPKIDQNNDYSVLFHEYF